MQKLLVSTCVALAVLAWTFPLVAAPPMQTPDTSGMTNQPSGAADAKSLSNLRASKVVGATVHDAQGVNLGEIEELAVCPKTGHVAYAIVGAGGVLGVGETKHAIPWRAFKASCRAPAGARADETQSGNLMKSPEIVLNVSKERLASAPEFKETDWGKFEDRQYTKQLDSYYNVTSTGAESTMRSEQTGQSGAATQLGSMDRPGSTTPSGSIAQTGKTPIQKASELVGMSVRNNSGADIGECEDLVFCAKTGQVRYVALSFDELGSGEKLFAVPFQSVAFSHQPNEPDNRFILCNVDQTEVTRHQGFSEENWPRTASEDWPVRR